MGVGGLPLRSFWIVMFLLPRKTHAIFLKAIYNYLFSKGTKL